MSVWGTVIILNTPGGPTPDKPEVVLELPTPDRTSAFLDIRVPDIAAFHRVTAARGATWMTPPIDRGPEIAATSQTPTGTSSRWASRTPEARGGEGGPAYPHDVSGPSVSAEEARLWRSMSVAMIRLLNEIEGDVKPVVDLTLMDLGILFSLNGTGPQPMGSLAALFGVDPSVITYRIGRLERMGHVGRGPSATDGRVTFATITPEGRAILKRARGTMQRAAREHFFAYVDPTALATLTTVFEDVLAQRPREAPPD